MIHDPILVERLSAFPTENFDGEVFRATRANLDPLAPSTSGGRWAPVGDVKNQIPVLYTSLENDGALAEISYHWSRLIPPPSKPAIIHRLRVNTDRTLRLVRADLEQLESEATAYSGNDYRSSREIGAAVAFLGCDGLIVPCARWDCDNLVIFMENHDLSNHLSVIASEEVDWKAWARDTGFLPGD